MTSTADLWHPRPGNARRAMPRLLNPGLRINSYSGTLPSTTNCGCTKVSAAPTAQARLAHSESSLMGQSLGLLVSKTSQLSSHQTSRQSFRSALFPALLVPSLTTLPMNCCTASSICSVPPVHLTSATTNLLGSAATAASTDACSIDRTTHTKLGWLQVFSMLLVNSYGCTDNKCFANIISRQSKTAAMHRSSRGETLLQRAEPARYACWHIHCTDAWHQGPGHDSSQCHGEHHCPCGGQEVSRDPPPPPSLLAHPNTTTT